MATCIDCIHQYCCKYDRFFGIDDVENKCNYFKPTADVVEIVRCKDCNNCEMLEDVYYCNYFNRNVDEGDYCSNWGVNDNGLY